MAWQHLKPVHFHIIYLCLSVAHFENIIYYSATPASDGTEVLTMALK